jgi:hypothetical protein
MDARSFIVAVGPVVAAEVVVGVSHGLLSPTEGFALHNTSAADWLVLAVSFLVFPLWAGARVARVTSMRRWYALGGASVLLGTLVAGAFSELLNPSPIDSSWLFVFVAPAYCITVLCIAGLHGRCVAASAGWSWGLRSRSIGTPAPLRAVRAAPVNFVS